MGIFWNYNMCSLFGLVKLFQLQTATYPIATTTAATTKINYYYDYYYNYS